MVNLSERVYSNVNLNNRNMGTNLGGGPYSNDVSAVDNYGVNKYAIWLVLIENNLRHLRKEQAITHDF